MNKKILLISLISLFVLAGILYISFSSNPTSSQDQTNEKNEPKSSLNAPPVPPSAKERIGKIAPPPPPPPVKKLNNEKKKPPGYKNFFVEKRPEPIHRLNPGEIKELTLSVIKGSEDFEVKWFKKDGKKLIQVGAGVTLAVSAEQEPIYYVAEVSDGVDSTQQLFFEVSPQTDPQSSAVQAEKLPLPKEKKSAVAIEEPTLPIKKEISKTQDKAPERPQEKIEVAKSEQVPEKKKVLAAPPQIKKNTVEINAMQDTDIRLEAGSPLTLNYETNSNEKLDIFWYHRPLGKKKSSLIKGKKELSFKLKRLNKYHQGEFYIQARDKKGSVYKSPEYKVRLK